MEKIRKFTVEFMNKDLETQFCNEEMKRNANLLGTVSLIFGLLYMSFFISDHFVIKNESTLRVIFLSRLVFLIISIVFYYTVKKVKDYSKLTYITSAFEIAAGIVYLVVLFQHESLSYLTFYSVIIMTLVIYLIPNKLIYSQIISIFLSFCFFMIYSRRIEDLDILVLLKLITYNLIIIIYCNISTYFTNYYKRKQFEDRLELVRASTTDALTGIYNRAKFDAELKHWIEYSKRYNAPITLVILDVDNFKKINDIYGHPVGDMVLRNIALIIKETIRSTDIFARWGGDEFVLLLTNTDYSHAAEIIERIRINIQNAKFEKIGKVTCSFGSTELVNSDNEETYLKRADNLLYEAKEKGKNISVNNKINDGT